jgi:hypothetical protein
MKKQWRRERERILAVPQAKNEKARITRWMSFWPMSALWTLINDPIRRAFEEIYHLISKALQEISDAAFADVVKLGDQDIPQSTTDEKEESRQHPAFTDVVPYDVGGKKVVVVPAESIQED